METSLCYLSCKFGAARIICCPHPRPPPRGRERIAGKSASGCRIDIPALCDTTTTAPNCRHSVPSPTGEGAYRWQIGERLPIWYFSLVRYDNQSVESPPFCSLPHGGRSVSLTNRRVVAELVFQPCVIRQPKGRIAAILSPPPWGRV